MKNQSYIAVVTAVSHPNLLRAFQHLSFSSNCLRNGVAGISTVEVPLPWATQLQIAEDQLAAVQPDSDDFELLAEGDQAAITAAVGRLGLEEAWFVLAGYHTGWWVKPSPGSI